MWGLVPLLVDLLMPWAVLVLVASGSAQVDRHATARLDR
jgi:hypothetical protein